MPLILVDASSYLFRAYHALPNLTNKKGFPTGAIFGVLSMLKKLRVDFPSPQILIVFDAKGKNFRHALYPDYKANRGAMPDDLAQQIAPLHQLIQLLGFPLYLHEGVEADDVIGALAYREAAQQRDVLIISPDKDLAQLLRPHVRIRDTMKNVDIDDAYLMEKFGIPASKMIDFLTLTGDTSDNIPGIPGVGPKTAAKWLMEYGSLDEIVAHHTDITGKVGEALSAHLQQLPLSKSLVTIKTDLDLGALPDTTMKAADHDALAPLFLEYGIKAMLPAQEAAITEPSTPTLLRKGGGEIPRYHLINDEASFKQFLTELQAQAYFTFDTETTGLDALQTDLVGISFSFKTGEAYFVSLEGVKSWRAGLAPIFADPLVGKIAHNAKFDLKVMHSHGLTVEGILFDTLLASYVLHSTANRHNLQAVAERELGLTGMSYEDLTGTGRNKVSILEVPLEKLKDYACEDADFTWQLYEIFRTQLDADPPLKRVFEDLEMPLFEILATMEEYGVLIDVTALHALSAQWACRLDEISDLIFKEVGSPFNLSSPKQLIEVLFHKLNLPIIAKTPKGEPSTNEAVLSELAPMHPVPHLMLEHRHLSKLKNTYTDKLPLLIHPKTGRIHTQYQQAVVATGRLSSTDPNLQNIPFKTDEGKKIREAFIAAPGCVLVSADYSQVELRIMAHLSEDAGLIQAFKDGKDIHRATAAEVLGIPESAVTSDQRRQAKAVNFGLIYGMSSFGLAKQLSISRKEADLYIQRYFARYPGVYQYMERTRTLAHQQGYVETLLGRRLTLPQINSRNKMEQNAAERAAINAPMQGTAADLIKKAMIDFNEWIKAHPEMNAHLTMQVHDELVVETPEPHAKTVAEALQSAMEQALELKVPLVVDISVGASWV